VYMVYQLVVAGRVSRRCDRVRDIMFAVSMTLPDSCSLLTTGHATLHGHFPLQEELVNNDPGTPADAMGR
jgi:hypothetical protein